MQWHEGWASRDRGTWRGRGRAMPAAAAHDHRPPRPPPLPARSRRQTTSSAAATSERLRKETDLAIQQVQSDVTTSKSAVVNMLLKYATTVDLKG